MLVGSMYISRGITGIILGPYVQHKQLDGGRTELDNIPFDIENSVGLIVMLV
jgi:hypothetical protein